MITCFLIMNRSEQEHLYRQSRQVSIIQSSPVLLDPKDDILLSVLRSPVNENRRKSSSVLLKPGFLKGRRNSQKSLLSPFRLVKSDAVGPGSAEENRTEEWSVDARFRFLSTPRRAP
ncbi:UNVERIFIED_CONTAM: hypothetical protein PYX00_010702 [Menopon gallinae]|uniref:Uncharacterized protein n=1 Tax=Menopon gallinae TaxID=328185 RepID=A0AAW2HGG8_9NEOP